MTKTINAMKQAQWLIARQKEWMHAVPQDTVLPAMPGFDGDYANQIEESLSSAIRREEAQTVAPFGEQEALIARIDQWEQAKSDEPCHVILRDARAMLAADARFAPHPESSIHAGYSAIDGVLPPTHSAQQVAVPQGLALVPEIMVLGSVDLRFLHGLSQPDDDGEYSEIRLSVGDGHAGHGLYASIDEYPEEGADIICKFPAAPRPPQGGKP